MTNKESKIQELINLAKNDTPLAPPCCEGCILDLFNSYFHLWLPQCSNSDTFVDDIIKKYPSHSKTDIVRLKEYLSAAHKYLIDICCAFAGVYQKYGGMSRKDYGTDQKYCDILIHACLKKYTWLTEDYLYENLYQLCRLCNW